MKKERNKMLKKIKFEYLFACVLLVVLSAALFGAFYVGNFDLVNIIVTALIGTLASITAFFFTKHQNKREDEL
jgi:general stress protein CsbA